jgi:hypothetical protein
LDEIEGALSHGIAGCRDEPEREPPSLAAEDSVAAPGGGEEAADP